VELDGVADQLGAGLERVRERELFVQLYLVQHGAAKSEAEDPQRRLTAEGTKTVERMAAYLSALKLHLDDIEHSDKERARETAEIMATHLHPAEGTRQVAGIAPNDDVGLMRERLQKESHTLMILGHLPHLSRLLSVLLGAQEDRTLVTFQMGGVVHVEREDNGEWRMRWILVPELLPDRTSPHRNTA
jgi:phosphohistidine phosphatase